MKTIECQICGAHNDTLASMILYGDYGYWFRCWYCGEKLEGPLSSKEVDQIIKELEAEFAGE